MTKILQRILFSLILILFLGAPQIPPSPPFRPFGDNANWIVIEDMEYIIGSTNEKIVVPMGFVTDFASIPKPLWSFNWGPHGQYSRAAVVHDFLYWSQGCTRDQADRLLVIAMKESRVSSFDEWAIFKGVHVGGESSWNTNKFERNAGLPRIIPKEYMRPKNPNENWPTYQKMLIQEKIQDPIFVKNPSYCKFGDIMEVP